MLIQAYLPPVSADSTKPAPAASVHAFTGQSATDTSPVSKHVMTPKPKHHQPLFEQVLQRLPQLQSLDGRAVEGAERRSVAGCLRHEGAIMNLMLANANLAHKLVRRSSCLLSMVHQCFTLRRRAMQLSQLCL